MNLDCCVLMLLQCLEFASYYERIVALCYIEIAC